MNEFLEIARENNKLLKEILTIMNEISSQEHIKREDMKALAINIIANLLSDYRGDRLKKILFKV